MDITLGLLLAKSKTAVETFDFLRSFVNNELGDIIEKIGDIDFASAKKVLQDVKSSSKPEREIALAIGHFHTAKEAFDSYVEADSDKWIHNWEKADDCTQKSIMCLLMITICYASLSEKDLTKQYAERLKEAYINYCEDTYWRYPYDTSENIRWANKNLAEIDEGENNLIALFHSLGLEGWKSHNWLQAVKSAWQDKSATDENSEGPDRTFLDDLFNHPSWFT